MVLAKWVSSGVSEALWLFFMLEHIKNTRGRMAVAKVGVRELSGSLSSATDCDPQQVSCPLESSVTHPQASRGCRRRCFGRVISRAVRWSFAWGLVDIHHQFWPVSGACVGSRKKVSPFGLLSDLWKKSIPYISVPAITWSKCDIHLIRLDESNMVFL